MVIRKDCAQEPRLVDRERRCDHVSFAKGESAANRVVVVHVGPADWQALVIRFAEIRGSGVDTRHAQPCLAGEDFHVVHVRWPEVHTARDRRVPERAGSLRHDDSPHFQVIVGRSPAGYTVIAVVRVDEGRARIEAAKDVGDDLVRSDGHVWVACFRRGAVHGRFDDDGRFGRLWHEDLRKHCR